MKSKQEWEQFYTKHWKGADLLTVVLKSHLYIENLLDKFFLFCLPKPKYIIEKKFYDKVKIFESLGLSPSDKLIQRLLALNTIRNKYAHNLNYTPRLVDLKVLIDDIKLLKGNNRNKLTRGIVFTISYLHGALDAERQLPFSFACIRNKKIYNKEKAINVKKIMKKIYPKNEAVDLLENLKIK